MGVVAGELAGSIRGSRDLLCVRVAFALKLAKYIPLWIYMEKSCIGRGLEGLPLLCGRGERCYEILHLEKKATGGTKEREGTPTLSITWGLDSG